MDLNKETKNKKIKIFIFSILFVVLLNISIFFGIYYFKDIKIKCPNGYNYNGEKCSKMEYIVPNEIKYCDSGYELENEVCKKKEILDATKNYRCPDEESSDLLRVSKPTLVGTKCKYTLSFDAVIKRECLSNCYLSSEEQCNCKLEIPAAVNGVGEHQRLFCLTDWHLEGNNCVHYSYPKPIIKKLCIEDFTLKDDICIKESYYDALVYLSCPTDFYLDGNYCYKISTINYKTKQECPIDYDLQENKCVKEIFVDTIN